MLIAPFTEDEFKKALFQMHPDKTPGPDSFNPAFFQKFWHVIGTDVVSAGCQWLEQMTFPSSLNDTNVVLIPKCDHPESMKDLRPISLCNVLYRVVSKALANRLKGVMGKIISEEQSAFTSGRSITDNVLVGF